MTANALHNWGATSAPVLASDGPSAYVNASGSVVPPGVVTVTPATPPACAGAVKPSEVGLVTVTCDAGITTSPIVTDVRPGTKPDPVTVTAVPPDVGPDGGVNPLELGAAT